MADRNVTKRKLGSYPFASVIFSVTLSLLVIGLFGLLFLLSNSLTQNIKRNVEIQVYLDKSIRDSEVNRIRRTIGSKPYVLADPETESIRFISEDEAAREFVEETGEDFSEFLGDNPLRDVFVIKINSDYQSLDSLKWIASGIEEIRGVYEVSYVASLIESINKNLAKAGAILLGFAVILLVVVLILINNTIKLAMFSQRFLIRSMQLVGATANFIRRPFLNRALLYGLSSGLVAGIVLFAILIFANRQIPDLVQLQSRDKLLALFGAMLFLGVVITYGSTFFAVKRYLKTSLDELY